MARTPFDLSFEDLVQAGVRAARAAADEAKQADVPLAAFEAEAIDPPPWNEARQTLLRSLWLDGVSATQIAMRLGGVTRNQVIREVHRLGLSGERPSARPTAPVRTVAVHAGTATVMTLGAHMCKWPIGDPSSAEFTFCGRRASEGVYCVEHAQIAYQPVVRRDVKASAVRVASAGDDTEIEVRRRLSV